MRLPSLALATLLPGALLAEVPQVVTDIAPIQSLVAQVMGDLGTPALLLPPGADPHDFALRPSDAARLGQADLVIWAGAGLTPWLGEPLDTLAGTAARLSLLETGGWTPRMIEADDHGHGHDHGGHEGHDDHADEHHPGGEGLDPHAWLDPQVAQVWVGAIAEALAAADPENADGYAANAATATADLARLDAELAATLSALPAAGYLLPHDAYGYFEDRYGLKAAGHLSGIDARDPGPAALAALREEAGGGEIACVFWDAEIGADWAEVVTDGSAAKVLQLDATGALLEPGPALYADLMRGLAAAYAECLAP